VERGRPHAARGGHAPVQRAAAADRREHQIDVTAAREDYDRLQRWRSEGEEIKARSQADSRRIV
jgi:hypothetical protein